MKISKSGREWIDHVLYETDFVQWAIYSAIVGYLVYDNMNK